MLLTMIDKQKHNIDISIRPSSPYGTYSIDFVDHDSGDEFIAFLDRDNLRNMANSILDYLENN